MPAKSKKQERFMQAVAHSPKFAKKVGVSKAVAGKFVGPKAHKAEGGEMRSPAKRRPMEPPPAPAKRRPMGPPASPAMVTEPAGDAPVRRRQGRPMPEDARVSPEAAREMRERMADEEMMRNMGRQYDRIMGEELDPEMPPVKRAKGGSVDRIGRAVTPSRRDPDIGKLIKAQKVPTAGAGSGMGRMQKARKMR